MISDTQRPARLGIVHLLLWTAGCGAMLAAQRLLTLDTPSERTPEFAEWMSQIGAAMIEGAALAGLLTGVVERLRQRAYPVQPGEWLLVACGTGVALDLVARLVIRISIPRIEPLHAAAIAMLPSTVASIGVYGLAFQKCWKSVEWAPLFSTTAFAQTCLLLAVLFVPFGGEASYYALPVAGILAPMCVGYVMYIYPNAIFHDLYARAPYGLLHWAGVILLPLHTAVYYIGLAMWLT